MDPTSYPFKINMCPTGCVHLHFGVATIHLAKEDFRALAHRMNELIRQSDPPAVPPKPPALKLLRLFSDH